MSDVASESIGGKRRRDFDRNLRQAIKAIAHHAAVLLVNCVPNGSLASSARVPWPARHKLAQIEMIARSVQHIGMRMSFLPNARYVKQYLMPESYHVGPIWQYWNSGAGRCPTIIEECMASVRRHAAGREVIVLSDDTLHGYVTLPAPVVEKREQMGATQFSDVLRATLLAQHGGTWIDASVLLTGGIDAITANLPFFMFTRPNDFNMISSWFIHSVADHPLACTMRDLMTEYWAREDELRAYFMFHFLFECAITLHADLRQSWQTTPSVSADSPHLLQNALLAGSEFERLQDICCRTPVHKLSHKFPQSVLLECERIAKWTRHPSRSTELSLAPSPA